MPNYTDSFNHPKLLQSYAILSLKNAQSLKRISLRVVGGVGKIF